VTYVPAAVHRQRAAELAAASVLGLSVREALHLVELAAPSTGGNSARQLLDTLQARPGVLTSGHSDVPSSVIALMRLLAEAGYTRVLIPTCRRCGRDKALTNRRYDGGRVCRDCARVLDAEPCSRCQISRTVATRTAAGAPVCKVCRAKERSEPCSDCGRSRTVAARLPNGDACCPGCLGKRRGLPHGECVRCHRIGPLPQPGDGGRICQRCYRRARPRPCERCGEHRPVAVRRANGWPTLCEPCAVREPPYPARCVSCGYFEWWCRPSFDGEPVCTSCRRQQADQAHRPQPPGEPGSCKFCGRAEEFRPGARRCNDCQLAADLDRYLVGPDGVISEVIRPVADYLRRTPNPASTRDWLRRRKGGLILRRLAACPEQQITHELLDREPPGRALTHLRALLVDCGVLAPREEYLERLEPWLEHLLDELPARHARILRPFATWQLLRRARQRARSAPFTTGAASALRTQVRAVIAFLSFLDEHHTTLADLDQHLIDQFLDAGPRDQHDVRGFLKWTNDRALTSGVSAPPHQRGGPLTTVSQDERWRELARWITADDAPSNVRAAAILVMLYGQSASRITALTSDDVLEHDGQTYLRLGTTPVLLPPRIATLIQNLRDTRTSRANYPRGQDAIPLFPGRSPGAAMTGPSLLTVLHRAGVNVRTHRNSALAGMAQELPEAVCASLLGVSITTANFWARQVSRDWSAYLEARDADSTAARPQQAQTAAQEP